jgi:hypothetical protein
MAISRDLRQFSRDCDPILSVVALNRRRWRLGKSRGCDAEAGLLANIQEYTRLSCRVASRDETAEFKEFYQFQAGIEGTISPGVHHFDLHRNRCLGLQKTHMQHVLAAAAITRTRAVCWLNDRLRAQVRQSRLQLVATLPERVTPQNRSQQDGDAV